jgi:hypothetical protein
MIKVFYDGELQGVLRPTPFVQITKECLYNKKGKFGITYNITLTGKILECEGTPYALKPGTEDLDDFFGSPVIQRIGPYGQFDGTPFSQRPRPPRQQVMTPAVAILSKQRAIRALFKKEGLVLSINDINDQSEAEVWFQPRVQSINFSEGQYINTCDYSITLQADRLHRGAVSQENWESEQDEEAKRDVLLGKLEDVNIESFTEDWSLEVEDQLAEATRLDGQASIPGHSDASDDLKFPKTYRLSHNISAVGKRRMNLDGTVYMEAWEAAKKFCQEYLITKNEGGLAYGSQSEADIKENSARAGYQYPNNNDQTNPPVVPEPYPNGPRLGDFLIGLPVYNNDNREYQGTDFNSYNSYNHSRNESIDEANGNYSLTENWVLATKPILEEFNTSISLSNSEAFTSVSIDGTITGLSSLRADEYATGIPIDGDAPGLNYQSAEPPFQSPAIIGEGSPIMEGYQRGKTRYGNAKEWLDLISNNGLFNGTSDIFLRAQKNCADFLNPFPLSISIAYDEVRGIITYSLQYNNRPLNLITGAISESIQINDTYPGDVFATIGVPGRATGPVLQYQGGRTEYKRDVSISLIMNDYTQLFDWENRVNEAPIGVDKYTLAPYPRRAMLLTKPSVRSPQKEELAQLLLSLSPANEPGVRKWFAQPPTENWTPKDGSYTLNISWVYELDV